MTWGYPYDSGNLHTKKAGDQQISGPLGLQGSHFGSPERLSQLPRQPFFGSKKRRRMHDFGHDMGHGQSLVYSS